MNHLTIVIFLVGLVYAIAQAESNPTDLAAGRSTLWIDETATLSPATNGAKKKKSWGLIYPGTKWCGQGNKAKHDNDLGKYKQTDRCCRAHDRCPKEEKIKGRESKYGIRNNGTVTILSCRCDDIFYDCLKGVRSKTSETVGTLYFDILKNRCFKQSSERSDEGYVMTKSRRFSQNKFINFVGKIFG